MKKPQSKSQKNFMWIWIVGAIIVVLVIIAFIMNKTVKSNCESAVIDYQQLAKTFEIQDKTVNN
jgi:uncharacterized integral membrane protein